MTRRIIPLVAALLFVSSAPAIGRSQAGAEGFFCQLATPDKEESQGDQRLLVLGSSAAFDSSVPVLLDDETGLLGRGATLKPTSLPSTDGGRALGFSAQPSGAMLILKKSVNDPEYYRAVLGTSAQRTTHVGVCHLITGSRAVEMIKVLGAKAGSAAR